MVVRRVIPFVIAIVSLGGCWADPNHGEWMVTSETVLPGKPLSNRHTGAGGFSPGFIYALATPNTRSVSVVMEDLDGKDGKPLVHWIVTDMAPKGYVLEHEVLSMSRVGKNGLGKGGFLPVEFFDPPHRMRVTFYALDKRTELETGFTRDQLDAAIKGHIEAEKKIDFLSPRKGAPN